MPGLDKGGRGSRGPYNPDGWGCGGFALGAVSLVVAVLVLCAGLIS